MSTKLDKITVKSSKSDTKSSDSKLKGRDTIYIDTEDDITSIIEKIKESDNTVIALVPPKRIGALQSVVNLKLLQKAAKANRKKIALVTNDSALTSLAATLSIPIAKSLNSQPELVEVPEVDQDELDVIDGNDIAIGDLAKMDNKQSDDRPVEDEEITAAVSAIETDDKIQNDLDADGQPDDQPKKIKKDKSRAVPNFNSFRKRLLIYGVAVLAAVIFFVWAIWFAPSGVIVVSAETTPKSFEVTVSLDPSSATNVSGGVIQPIVKQIKKTETLNFEATGSKEIGDKAKGKVVIYNKNDTAGKVTLNAGTVLITTGGLQFTLDSSVTVSGSTVSGGAIVPGSANASVTASAIGSSYNLDANTDLSVSGKGPKVYAVAKTDFAGGTKETVKVVEQSDLDTAVDELEGQLDDDGVESDLTGQMGSGVTALKDSFTVSYGDANSKPAVGETLSAGKATVTIEITYSLVGVSDSDLKALSDNQASLLVGDNQKVYDNGASALQFKNFLASGSKYDVTVKSTAQIGPKLDEEDIKNRSVGKRSGEISSELSKIPGVKNVEVKFSPFWVSSISDKSKLKVEFAVNE